MNENGSTNCSAASNKRTSCEEQCEKASLNEQGSECRAIFWYLG
jgi:hypothetical protein